MNITNRSYKHYTYRLCSHELCQQWWQHWQFKLCVYCVHAIQVMKPRWVDAFSILQYKTCYNFNQVKTWVTLHMSHWLRHQHSDALKMWHNFIPHLEMRACNWWKSCHVAYTKSQYCPHNTLLPSWIFMSVNIALINYPCLFDFSKLQLEPLDWLI